MYAKATHIFFLPNARRRVATETAFEIALNFRKVSIQSIMPRPGQIQLKSPIDGMANALAIDLLGLKFIASALQQ
jgi:hypothetical protein